ncbi:MAG: hypothetical protein NT140_13180 [Deltaproteobacteria bacterium]|nr:hypothetical protein [Deltaproteobacteria bacterium]
MTSLAEKAASNRTAWGAEGDGKGETKPPIERDSGMNSERKVVNITRQFKTFCPKR